MKKGDKVKIYEDPITEKKLEGEAVLIKQLHGPREDGQNYWKVKFLSDGFVCDRFIFDDDAYEAGRCHACLASYYGDDDGGGEHTCRDADSKDA